MTVGDCVGFHVALRSLCWSNHGFPEFPGWLQMVSIYGQRLKRLLVECSGELEDRQESRRARFVTHDDT